MQVTTLNVNGVRSALSKGLLNWLETHSPSVVLLQEVRAAPQPETFLAAGYHSCWHPAQKAGYSGVALLSRLPITGVQVGMNHPLIDAEGRVISANVGGVRFASIYLPSGSSGEHRQAFKEQVLTDFAAWTAAQLATGEPLVLGGDFNLAHTPLDLKNWRANQKNSGFLPHEREWFSAFLALGLRDSHREHLGGAAEYTWWSNRAGAYANNVGWRLDYLFTAGVEARDLWVDRAARLSDHAPLTGTLTAPP